MFYNTGIATYVWVLSNKKASERRGKVQLIDGSNLYSKMRKSLGSKRNEMNKDDIKTITRSFGDFEVVDARRHNMRSIHFHFVRRYAPSFIKRNSCVLTNV